MKFHNQKRNQKVSKKGKKGQIETMGLLVIVILISLILFFVLSFNINKARTAQPEKQDFKEMQAVSNFGTTMLETSDKCGRSIRELLADCAFTHQISCEGHDSCFTANETMSNILALTLDQWGYEYNLTVVSGDDQTILSSATGCNTSINSKKEITPFGTRYGSMSLVIKTCR